jgi:hypothetical protein
MRVANWQDGSPCPLPARGRVAEGREGAFASQRPHPPAPLLWERGVRNAEIAVRVAPITTLHCSPT